MEFEGSQGKNSVVEFDQDFASSLRDVEGSRRKISRANNFTKSSWVLHGMVRDGEGKSRELTKCHRELAGSSRDVTGRHGKKSRDFKLSHSSWKSEAKKSVASKITLLEFLYYYKRLRTLPKK
ncbi:hypothetical protein Acr_04g0002960 [Actinidia rufa]|uniref:Uncharacterized protein n=1 Tax=Actinidia rufa TaxID=165716 RepID=A0A7J0EGF5_9ERIC|nr:hypothetical protein Acr_04g0002960 [Actinidia rufa]